METDRSKTGGGDGATSSSSALVTEKIDALRVELNALKISALRKRAVTENADGA